MQYNRCVSYFYCINILLMHIDVEFFSLRVDTNRKSELQPLQGFSANFEECIVKGFARQVSHHTEESDRTMHSVSYVCAQASVTQVRRTLTNNTILLISLLIVLSLIIL